MFELLLVVFFGGFLNGFSPVPSMQTCFMLARHQTQKLNSLEPMGTTFHHFVGLPSCYLFLGMVNWVTLVSCDQTFPILMAQSLNSEMFTTELTMIARENTFLFQWKNASWFISFSRKLWFEWYIMSIPRNLSTREENKEHQRTHTHIIIYIYIHMYIHIYMTRCFSLFPLIGYWLFKEKHGFGKRFSQQSIDRRFPPPRSRRSLVTWHVRIAIDLPGLKSLRV